MFGIIGGGGRDVCICQCLGWGLVLMAQWHRDQSSYGFTIKYCSSSDTEKEIL